MFFFFFAQSSVLLDIWTEFLAQTFEKCCKYSKFYFLLENIAGHAWKDLLKKKTKSVFPYVFHILIHWLDTGL